MNGLRHRGRKTTPLRGQAWDLLKATWQDGGGFGVSRFLPGGLWLPAQDF